MKNNTTEVETDLVKLQDDQLNEAVGGNNERNVPGISLENDAHVENGISVDLYKDGRLM